MNVITWFCTNISLLTDDFIIPESSFVIVSNIFSKNPAPDDLEPVYIIWKEFSVIFDTCPKREETIILLLLSFI